MLLSQIISGDTPEDKSVRQPTHNQPFATIAEARAPMATLGDRKEDEVDRDKDNL